MLATIEHQNKTFQVDLSKPIDEPVISRLVASFLTSHGAARNFDVTCESVAGGGNIDLHVIAAVTNQGFVKVAIEAKKADSANLLQGLQVQLPEYMARIGTNYGIYLIYWLKSPQYPFPSQDDHVALELEVFRSIQRPPGIRTIAMNLSYGSSPSKRKAKS